MAYRVGPLRPPLNRSGEPAGNPRPRTRHRQGWRARQAGPAPELRRGRNRQAARPRRPKRPAKRVLRNRSASVAAAHPVEQPGEPGARSSEALSAHAIPAGRMATRTKRAARRGKLERDGPRRGQANTAAGGRRIGRQGSSLRLRSAPRHNGHPSEAEKTTMANDR
jgi:hypothetical protein